MPPYIDFDIQHEDDMSLGFLILEQGGHSSLTTDY